MQCPKCGTTMREREKETAGREVVVVDICPECQGLFLDRGELEKLTVAEERYYRDDDYRRGDDRSGGREQPKKKKSFLSNMFETFAGGEGGMDD